MIVLSNGFIKKTNKTPTEEIRESKFLQSRFQEERNTTDFNDYLKQQLQDPEFKRECDALEAEFTIIQSVTGARKEAGLAQKELSEKTGIAQAGISRLEIGFQGLK